MVEKVMYVLWNGVRGKTKNARERELCFRIPDSKIYISRETEEKKCHILSWKTFEEIVKEKRKRSSFFCEDYERLNTECKSVTDLLFER